MKHTKNMVIKESIESRELSLYAENTSEIYFGYIVPIVKNLAKKYAKTDLGVTKIYADVSTKNTVLQNAMKESGFLHTKTFKGGMSDNGDRMSYFASV